MTDDLIRRQDAIMVVKDQRLEAIGCIPEAYNAGVDASASVLEMIPSAQPEPKWTPCSKKLPDETGSYLVTNNNCVCPVEEAVFFANGSYWADAYIGTRFKDSYVLAWMPLPERYEVGNDS